ncbi:MAG: trypsin-like serine protease [Pirellulales bacterium]
MNRTRLMYFASAFLVLGPHHVHAIVTSDARGTHVVPPGTITFGLNLDGVARVEIGYPAIDEILRTGSGALISDRHVITAAHLFDLPPDGQLDSFPFEEFLRFSATFEAAGGPATLTFSKTSVRIMPNWPDTFADLAIVELDQPAPAGVPRYPLYGVGDELGQPTVIVGYGATGHGATGVNDESTIKRAGLNRFEAFGEEIDLGRADRIPPGSALVIDFDSGLARNNTLQEHFLIPSDLGFGADEVSTARGDSGGPAFIGGAIAGITATGFSSFPTDVTPGVPFDSAWGSLNFQTRISSFQDFIETATDGQAVFVPEPSTATLFTAATILALLCRALCRANFGGNK